MPVTYQCKECGETITTVPSRVRGGFCGRECSGKYATRIALEKKPKPIINEDFVKIPLSNGMFATVDRSDWDSIPELRELNWRVSKITREGKEYFYAYTITTKHTIENPHRSNIGMHRLITRAEKGTHVDHKDFDGLNNRRGNLQVCTPSENISKSRKHIRKDGTTSQYKGVSWRKDRNSWIVWCGRVYIGSSHSEIKAARMYNEAALKIFGEFAILNEIPEESP